MASGFFLLSLSPLSVSDKCGNEDFCYHDGYDHVAVSQHPEDPEQSYPRRFQDLDEILAPGRGLGEMVDEEEMRLYQ